MSERANATFEVPAPRSGGVRCLECSERACDALADVAGVSRVECDPGGGLVRVEFDPARVTEPELAEELERFGMTLAASVRHAAWRVSGLD